MPFQPAPDCAEAVIHGSYGGKPIANVLNFKLPGGYNQANIDQLANVMDVAIGDHYRPIFNSGVTYNSVVVRGLAAIIDLTASSNFTAGAGGVVGASLPANVSLVATLRTGFTGRSARGRFYCWPLTGSQLVSTNTFAASVGVDLDSFLTTVLTDAFAIGWNLVVLSRRTLNTVRPTAIATTVTEIDIRNLTVDSQRGRLPAGH